MIITDLNYIETAADSDIKGATATAIALAGATAFGGVTSISATATNAVAIRLNNAAFSQSGSASFAFGSNA